MKNIKLIGGLCLSALALTACNEDYTDWADPQAYGQEPSAASYGVNVASGGDIIGDNNLDSVVIAVMSTDRSEITGYKAEYVTIGDVTFSSDVMAFNGNTLKMSAKALAQELYKQSGSRASQKYDLDSKIVFSAMNNDQAVALAAEVKSTYTTPTLPDVCADGYVILGDFSGYGWDLTNPLYMTKVEDGIYQATVTTTSDGSNWYKFYEATDFKAKGAEMTWDAANAAVIGVAENGDASTPNFLVYANDKVYGDVQTPTITGAGNWTITLNVKNGTLSYERQVSKYFLTGNPNGWNSASNTMFYCLGGGKYSYTTYFKGAWDVKFWEDKYLGDWGNIWGAGNGDGAASGKLIFGSDAGAFQAPSAGYWTLTLNMNDGSYTWTSVAEGTVYNSVSIIGGFNDWSGDVDMTQISAANGDTHNWYGELTLTSATELKFRANHDWSVSWGSTKGTAVDSKLYYGETGSENITVPAGSYKCYLNDITGQWSIVAK